MTLIDTAEMYGEGGAEKVVADAIEGQPDGVFIVTKVYPHNASRTELPKACERSLKRLRVDAIDLYLLHCAEGRRHSRKQCKRSKSSAPQENQRWGVSNFDVDDMQELFSIENACNCAANQVLYNLENREIEFDLLPFFTSNLKPKSASDGFAVATPHIPIMAYSPVGHDARCLETRR